jgi:hypothetical protein
MLQQARRGSLLTPGSGDINIRYLIPGQGSAMDPRFSITPQVPRTIPLFRPMPFSLSDDVEDAMTDAPPASRPVKRSSEDEATSPTSKARTDEPEREPTIRTKNPVKKTETKQTKIQNIQDELSEILLEFSVDALRSKFARRFPNNTKVKKKKVVADH